MFLFLFLRAVKGKSAFNTGHARQFRFPFTFIQTDALRKCLAVLDLLRHPEVAERPGGKLWPVRYQKHFPARRTNLHLVWIVLVTAQYLHEI